MAQMDVLKKSDYLLSLEIDNKDIAVRYKLKIKVIQGIDPFSLTPTKCQIPDLSPEGNFPPVTAFDISTYLVLTHSFYTNQQMKAYKSLAGYKYYEAGFVHDCEARTIGEYVVILGKVRHSQRMNNPLLKVWIICEKDGAINSAHCTCMAGNSEVCSHVAALLFGLEHSHRSASNLTCTDVKAKWLIPSISNVPIIRLGEMKLKKTTPGRISSINIIPAIEGEELLKYLDKIKGSDDDSAIMRVVEPYASDLSLNIQRSFLPSLYNTIYKKENEIQTYEHLCALH